MAMLNLGTATFSLGRAAFRDSPATSTQGSSSRVFVKVAVPGMDEPFLALLDTGAEWSVLDREIAEEIGLANNAGYPITIRHKDGSAPGKLVRTSVTLLADEGEALAVEATVFVPDTAWPTTPRNFIGYSGLLERVRFALDPQTNDIYFGGYSDLAVQASPKLS